MAEGRAQRNRPTDALCKGGFCARPLDLPDFCPAPNSLHGVAYNAGKCGAARTYVGASSECGQMHPVVQPLPLGDGEPIVLGSSPSKAVLPALAVQGGKLYYALGHDVHAVSTDPAQPGDGVVTTAT